MLALSITLRQINFCMEYCLGNKYPVCTKIRWSNKTVIVKDVTVTLGKVVLVMAFVQCSEHSQGKFGVLYQIQPHHLSHHLRNLNFEWQFDFVLGLFLCHVLYLCLFLSLCQKMDLYESYVSKTDKWVISLLSLLDSSNVKAVTKRRL